MKDLLLLFFIFFGLEVILYISVVYFFAKMKRGNFTAERFLILFYSVICFLNFKYGNGVQLFSRSLLESMERVLGEISMLNSFFLLRFFQAGAILLLAVTGRNLIKSTLLPYFYFIRCSSREENRFLTVIKKLKNLLKHFIKYSVRLFCYLFKKKKAERDYQHFLSFRNSYIFMLN